MSTASEDGCASYLQNVRNELPASKANEKEVFLLQQGWCNPTFCSLWCFFCGVSAKDVDDRLPVLYEGVVKKDTWALFAKDVNIILLKHNGFCVGVGDTCTLMCTPYQKLHSEVQAKVDTLNAELAKDTAARVHYYKNEHVDCLRVPCGCLDPELKKSCYSPCCFLCDICTTCEKCDLCGTGICGWIDNKFKICGAFTSYVGFSCDIIGARLELTFDQEAKHQLLQKEEDAQKNKAAVMPSEIQMTMERERMDAEKKMAVERKKMEDEQRNAAKNLEEEKKKMEEERRKLDEARKKLEEEAANRAPKEKKAKNTDKAEQKRKKKEAAKRKKQEDSADSSGSGSDDSDSDEDEITIPQHKHDLEYVDNWSFSCDLCGSTNYNTPAYTCKKCRFDAHVKCAGKNVLPPGLKGCIDLGAHVKCNNTIQWQHKTPYKAGFKCNVCREGGHFPAYHCARCDFDCHADCALEKNAMFRKTWNEYTN